MLYNRLISGPSSQISNSPRPWAARCAACIHDQMSMSIWLGAVVESCNSQASAWFWASSQMSLRKEQVRGGKLYIRNECSQLGCMPDMRESSFDYCRLAGDIWRNPDAKIEDRVESLLAQLTVAEMISSLDANKRPTGGISRLGIPGFTGWNGSSTVQILIWPFGVWCSEACHYTVPLLWLMQKTGVRRMQKGFTLWVYALGMTRRHQGEACNSVFWTQLMKGKLLVSECLHGGVDTGETGYGTTSFPQPLSLAATFDRKLLHQIASMISDEMRAISNLYRQADGTARSKCSPRPSSNHFRMKTFLKAHIHHSQQGHLLAILNSWIHRNACKCACKFVILACRALNCFGPNINLIRDPRWGRASETYGEDPYLTAELSVAYVTGLQGNDSKYVKVIHTFAIFFLATICMYCFSVQTDDATYTFILVKLKQAIKCYCANSSCHTASNAGQCYLQTFRCIFSGSCWQLHTHCLQCESLWKVVIFWKWRLGSFTGGSLSFA